MNDKGSGLTILYPELGAKADLWFTRMSGHGLGNCLYTYFHTVVLAHQESAAIIAPPWLSLKIGPLLRGESSKRSYWGMFKPFTGELLVTDLSGEELEVRFNE